MANFTVQTVASASPDLQDLVRLLVPQLRQLEEALQAFRQQPAAPERACAFEKKRRRFYERPDAYSWRTLTTIWNRSGCRTVPCGCGCWGRNIGAGPRAAM
jgi:hypothetical protein